MARYETSTTPVLALKWEKGQVVLDSESEPERPPKLLYPLFGQPYTVEGARAVYFAVKAQYERRRREEA